MVKKIEKSLRAHLSKNVKVERGGAWLLITENEYGSSYSAWSNPSAAKRYLKQYVLENTARKSIKMDIKAKDDNGKAIDFFGYIAWKVDAQDEKLKS